MSVQTQIDRLNKAKSDLKTSITNKGVAVSDDALISDYPALVDSIQTGGGGNVFDASLGGKLAYSTFETLPYNIINTSQVTNMYYLFGSCQRLTSLDLSNFNTSNVTNMGSMFDYCVRLTSLDLSSFNTSNVRDMDSMFSDCWALTSLDLSSFDTSNVTNMSRMFDYCGKLETLDLSNFNTDAVNTSGHASIFKDCTKLTTVKVINCNDTTKQFILTQLQTDIKTKTWTLGEDGIIRSS